jgi:peptidoglycan L-alanyl-D-glutamate endopeptidase CwlK
MFKLSAKSLSRLEGVHPDLVKVVHRAIENSTVDFAVLEGLRTPERQQQLVKAGASLTLKSRHLTGHAVDLGAIVGGQVRWDWPLYYKISEVMKDAAKDLKVPITWGGDWTMFKDGPHFELNRKTYP